MGVLKSKIGPSLKLRTGPSFFTVFPICVVFLGMFINTNSVTLCHNTAFVFAKFWGCQKLGFQKDCLFMLEKEKQKKEKQTKWKRPKKPYKNSCFLRWSSKNVKKQKNRFYQKMPDTICVRKGEKRAFSCRLFFWPKCFLDQNSVNQEKL